MDEAPPIEQQARHERNAIAHVLKDLAESRHDVEQKKRNDERADAENHGRIDRSGNDALSQLVGL